MHPRKSPSPVPATQRPTRRQARVGEPAEMALPMAKMKAPREMVRFLDSLSLTEPAMMPVMAEGTRMIW